MALPETRSSIIADHPAAREEADPDDVKVELFTKILSLFEPGTTWAKEANDEGQVYYNVVSPDGVRINYFIEPEGDIWEGKPRGRIGLPAIKGAKTPGMVAFAAAVAAAEWLFSLGQTALGLVLGEV
jgi:hypothetical protein